ncbi:MAG: hypothetical protein HQ483_01720 [Rhodospirillales bacterium]|nr:hypothetical protein [Rhodospirillales bacterium]
MKQSDLKSSLRHRASACTAAFVLITLAGCVPATTGGAEGIGFRQARFEEISAMRQYRECVDDAYKVAEDAARNQQAAGYRTSARIIEKCEADLGPEARNLAQEERMQAYAVGILNYIKAGDIQNAQANLDTFERTYGGYDLYLPSGASFIDTVSVLTGKSTDTSASKMAMLNLPPDLRAEMQRTRFWKHN